MLVFFLGWMLTIKQCERKPRKHMVDLEKTYMRSLVSRLTGTEQDEVRGMWSWMCWISVISARSLSFRQLDLNTWLRFSEACDIERLSSVQLLSPVRLFATPWIAACQASLSITNSQNLLKLMSIESMMPSNHLILFCPLLLLPSILASASVERWQAL